MEITSQLQSSKSKYSFSQNAKLLMKTAQENNIPILKIDKKNDLFQLGYGKYSVLFKGLIAEECSAIFSNSNDSVKLINCLLSSLGIDIGEKKGQLNKKEYTLLVVNQQLKAVLKLQSNSRKNLLSELAPKTEELIIKIAKLFSLNTVEISIATSSIKAPINQNGEIVDMNYNPDLTKYSTVIDLEEVSQSIVDYYQPAQIPIITGLGENNNLTVKLVHNILETAGVKTGVYLNNAIYTTEYSFNSNNNEVNNLNLLLQDKEIETIVKGISYQDLEQKDLAYKHNEIFILTNKLNNLAINLENSLLLSQIINSNRLVLSADNQQIIETIGQMEEGEIIYCSLNSENLVIKNQINRNNPVVFIEDNNLILFDGVDKLPVIALNKLPQVLSSNTNLLREVLFTIAVSFYLKIPVFVIRTILQNLNSELLFQDKQLNLTINNKMSE